MLCLLQASDDSIPTSWAGSFHYMAPELLESVAKVRANMFGRMRNLWGAVPLCLQLHGREEAELGPVNPA